MTGLLELAPVEWGKRCGFRTLNEGGKPMSKHWPVSWASATNRCTAGAGSMAQVRTQKRLYIKQAQSQIVILLRYIICKFG